MALLQDYAPFLESVRSAVKPGQPAYVVGGAVRDSLLGLPIHDLDFALVGNTLQVARAVAKQLKAHYYALDDERQATRVILTLGDGSLLYLDFIRLFGGDLDQDLRHRDFTVNAMALSLADPSTILDPCLGQADLAQKMLRPCSPTSLVDDPVRALRGIRLAIQFGWQMAVETVYQIKQAFPRLGESSPERQRDELFKILSGPKPDQAFRLMERLGGLPYLLPELAALKGETQSPPHELDVWEHTLTLLRHLSWLTSCFNTPLVPDPFQDDLTNRLALHLNKFQPAVLAHLEKRLNPDRSHVALLYLAGLYHDVAKPATRTVDSQDRIHAYRHEQVGADVVATRGRALVLSHPELDWLRTVVRQHMRVHSLAQVERELSRRAIYHFFKDSGAAGIDVCLLSLADTLATYGPILPDEVWEGELAVVSSLFSAWWEKPEQQVRPPALVDGNLLIKALELKPGPQIGRLLERIREAQIIGQVQTQEEALEFARRIMEEASDESSS